MTDKQYTAADTLRSAIEALERELSACTLEAHRAIGHRLRAILAAHPEESLRWQCPKCGSSKAEQIPPFHYCQVTGHHEQMSRISRESAPAKEEWFAGDPTGGLSNLPPERNTAKPAEPCPCCDGTGLRLSDEGEYVCTYCEGTGKEPAKPAEPPAPKRWRCKDGRCVCDWDGDRITWHNPSCPVHTGGPVEEVKA